MNKVFKWFTAEGACEHAEAYTSWFARTFDVSNFSGIEKLFYCFLSYCAKLSVVPRRAFLVAYLSVDAKRDIKKYNIKTDTMESYDYREASQLEAAFSIIAQVAKDTYEQYLEEDISSRDFKVDIYDYMVSRSSEDIQKAMLDTYPKLTDGSDVRELSEHLKADLVTIEETFNTDKIKEIDYSSSSNDGETKMRFLCPTRIPAIDGDCGGIYTRMLVTIAAQPGGGKTRLALVHYAYQVLTVAKQDVLFYETELSVSQTKNILIAYHITQIYGGRIKIPDSLMNKPEDMTEQQKQIYESAKIDLFESDKYGKFIVKEECIVENLEDELRSFVKISDKPGLIVIDYMGLIESVPASKWDKSLDDYQIITNAYKIVRKILKAYDVGAVCINQYNDKGIDAAYAGKPMRSGYIQGGHITHRHTDYHLDMTYTEEQWLAHVRGLSSSKSRGSGGFSNALLQLDLSVSYFTQQVKQGRGA